jgi:hypothetical protein
MEDPFSFLTAMRAQELDDNEEEEPIEEGAKGTNLQKAVQEQDKKLRKYEL